MAWHPSSRMAAHASCAAAMAVVVACAAQGSKFDDDDTRPNESAASGVGGGAGGDDLGLTSGSGGGGVLGGDPTTCEEAVSAKTYMGCDFWPTVTPNNVWSIFDFAAVVANTGENTVSVNVTRGGQPVATAQVAPNSLQTIYLPWVPQLKGPDADAFGSATPVSASADVPGGAYHLTTDYPVTVYQFNALEYAPQGGPPGKNWNACPAVFECFSYSNDASLLLPSSALTGNYRVTGTPGWQAASMGPYVAITGIEDNTSVTFTVGGGGAIAPGGGLSSSGPGGKETFTLGAGQVKLIVGTATADLSGSLIAADKPVQVISGMPCTNVPFDVPACDHIEESVFPAETLGSHYVVAPPTGPLGDTPGHVVRIYGNFDGTTLTYEGTPPPNAPQQLDAGQVVDLGIVTNPFEVIGSQSFAVVSLQIGGSQVDPLGGEYAMGDPAQSLATGVEQFRKKYVFLAPNDYPVSYADIIMPLNAQVTVDNQPLTTPPQAIGSGKFGVARVKLGPGNFGAHLLEANEPVGVQVAGYGAYTSYYYPGGLNLKAIAPPPVK